MRLNRARGGRFEHLTICAEEWILDRRLRVLILDAMMLAIFFERDHCRKQYHTYGINQQQKRFREKESLGSS